MAQLDSIAAGEEQAVTHPGRVRAKIHYPAISIPAKEGISMKHRNAVTATTTAAVLGTAVLLGGAIPHPAGYAAARLSVR